MDEAAGTVWQTELRDRGTRQDSITRPTDSQVDLAE